MMSSNRLKLLLSLFTLFATSAAWGSSGSDRVLLSDVKTLTLYNGKMTTGRRSNPVPQLSCIGGSAGCSSYVPPVVQCQNKGSDGYDIQWECKADLDNAYRFGKVEVTCEGYDYPDDPYILKGSCGLEYSLELTKEGYQQQNQHNEYRNQHSGYNGHSYQHQSSNNYTKKSSFFGDLVLLAVVGVVIYALYKTCIAPSSQGQGTGGAGTGSRRPPPYPSGSPPPYGFRDDHSSGDDYGGGCSSSYSSHRSTYATPGANTGGGFWTGAATGGLLGYMFGSRTNQNYHRAPTNSWGSGWGGFGGSRTTYSSPNSGTRAFGGGSFSAGGSTGTRTASGFGGTKRR